jgi:hypothetical protein
MPTTETIKQMTGATSMFTTQNVDLGNHTRTLLVYSNYDERLFKEAPPKFFCIDKKKTETATLLGSLTEEEKCLLFIELSCRLNCKPLEKYLRKNKNEANDVFNEKEIELQQTRAAAKLLRAHVYISISKRFPGKIGAYGILITPEFEIYITE